MTDHDVARVLRRRAMRPKTPAQPVEYAGVHELFRPLREAIVELGKAIGTVAERNES